MKLHEVPVTPGDKPEEPACNPSSGPPGVAECNVIVSGIKQCIWPRVINLYGAQIYNNKSEIFA